MCYLHIIMNIITKHLFRSLAILLFFIGIVSCSTNLEDNFSDHVKVSLREVGHHLLLANQDSTSLVKPVLALDKNKYQIAFENELFIHPDSLIAIVKHSFEKADLPQYYLTEVIRCDDNEVAYSYEMNKNVENGIIPCRGRQLKKGCYLVTVRFVKTPETVQSNSILLYMLGLGVLLILVFILYKRKSKVVAQQNDTNYSSIGRFKFYPEQNKLIKEATEISLSRKECELLEIFISKPNQVIKRDELTKKVWEDNGVIVGRSLDTYISKLRKKLKDDESIKLTNVHGVGYKLEI